MKINFSIIDVNLASVNAMLDYVAVQPQSTLSGKIDAADGKADLTLPDDVWEVTISIIPREHNDDLVRLYKKAESSEWQIDNPICRLSIAGTDLSLTATVIRLRAAPVVYVPDDQIPRMAGNPSGVLIYKDNEGFIYHSLFADAYVPFMHLKHPILEPKIKEDANEWERLRVEGKNVDPKKSGIFFHLEYGDKQSGPRLFLSLYLPSPSTRRELDYVVFYSPTTAIPNRFPSDKFPFRGNYPYGMTDKTSQEYPRLSQTYLFNGTHLVHQLLTAESTAVIVMPLAPYGDWSVFQTRTGLYRLLLECTYFLHREYLTTSHASVRPKWPEYERAGGSVRLPTSMGAGVQSSIFAHFEPIPKITRVAIAAFSSGCIALQKLLVDAEGKLPEGFTQERFGFNNTSAFENVFKEVWDIDGAHTPYHGYEAFESALSKWHARGGRRFRLYHTQYTGGDRDSMSNNALKHLLKNDDIINEPTVKDKGAIYWAKERHNANSQWSCVRFADGFLSSSNPSNARPYWIQNDAHHFLPKIAFGHAAYLFNQY